MTIFKFEELISNLNSAQFASRLGFLVGICHHFLIQYPRQADIFTTIYSYVAGNVVFGVAALLPKNAPGLAQISQGLLFFNLTYVPATISILISRFSQPSY
jgi:hypothetical protein